MRNIALTAVARIGGYVCEQWHNACYLAAAMAAVLWASVQPGNWPRTVRNVFARQMLFTGVEAVRFVVLVAILVGISVVVETYLWLNRVGLSGKSGSLLVVLVARELGP